MQRPKLTDSFIIRVLNTDRGQRLVLHNLKTSQTTEFDSWPKLCRHARIDSNLKGLKQVISKKA